MKKLVSLFLWFCTATFLAQVCILGLAASKGNISRKAVAQAIGLLNGIDIQGERLKQALISVRETPPPTYDDVLNAKTNAVLQLDRRSDAVEKLRRQLDDQQLELKKRTEEFDERRLQFERKMEQIRSGNQTDSLKEVQTLLENMEAEKAKEQLVMMLKNKELADVVTIIRGMAAAKQKKVLAEFVNEGDDKLIAEVLQEIRRGQPVPSSDPTAKQP